MDEQEKQMQQAEELPNLDQPETEWELPKAKIAYVAAIVAVLCGGNGVSILLAGLYYKNGGAIAVAIGIVVGITAAALAAVGVIVAIHRLRVRRKRGAAE